MLSYIRNCGIVAFLSLIVGGVFTTCNNTAFAEDLTCPVEDVNTAAEFVDLADCVLQLIYEDDWALLSAEDQNELSDYSTIFTNARQRLTSKMKNEVIPYVAQADSNDINDFETIIQNCYILEEVEAFQKLLINTSVGSERRRVAKEQMEKSIKDLLKDLADKAPWGLGKYIKALIDVINEVLRFIRVPSGT